MFVLQTWITLGRAQLNFGEPDSAMESFDKALAIKVRSFISLPVYCYKFGFYVFF